MDIPAILNEWMLNLLDQVKLKIILGHSEDKIFSDKLAKQGLTFFLSNKNLSSYTQYLLFNNSLTIHHRFLCLNLFLSHTMLRTHLLYPARKT